MSSRMRVTLVFAALGLVALPSWGLPPCTQSAAGDACSSYCGIIHQTSCGSATVEFHPECRFVFTCSGVFGTYYQGCSCGGGCFLAGTEITMADGTTTVIEEIQAGDVILAFDEATGEMKPDKVLEVHAPSQWDYYLNVNGDLKLTAEHPVLSGGEWMEIGKLQVGDTLTRADGTVVPIESIETVHEAVTVYNFAVNPYESYVAGGIIVHNKPPKIKEQ